MGCKVGNNIRQLRMEREWTQFQLAKKLNITRQTLSNYEVGKRLPDADMLIDFADTFDITIDSLLGRN